MACKQDLTVKLREGVLEGAACLLYRGLRPFLLSQVCFHCLSSGSLQEQARLKLWRATPDEIQLSQSCVLFLSYQSTLLPVVSLQFSRVHVWGLSTTEHLFGFSLISDLNTKQLLSTWSLDQALCFFFPPVQHVRFFHASSNQVKTTRCDTQNGLVSRT